MMGTLREVKTLHTWFFTEGGVVQAVNGISCHRDAEETSGVVGESGGSKSVALPRLVPRSPAGISGEICSDARVPLQLSKRESLRKDSQGECRPIRSFGVRGSAAALRTSDRATARGRGCGLNGPRRGASLFRSVCVPLSLAPTAEPAMKVGGHYHEQEPKFF